MAQHPDDGLAELRRRAYSRSGTAEDLRRLAELETSSEPEEAPEEGLETPIAEAPALEQPAAVKEHPAPSRRRVILLSGAVGLLVGATLATLGILLPHGDDPAGPPQPPGPTALAIFDRAPTERDDPTQLVMTLAHILPGGLQDAELRWLGDVADHEVYVARGTYADIVKICLISARSDSTAAACTDQSEFEVAGLNLGDGSLELRWGPLGTEIWVTEHTD